MPVTGYAPYTVRFVGGVLHGRSFEVPSLAPERYWPSSGPEPRSWPFPPASRDRQPYPPGLVDLYGCAPLESGEGSCIDYIFKRTVGSR